MPTLRERVTASASPQGWYAGRQRMPADWVALPRFHLDGHGDDAPALQAALLGRAFEMADGCRAAVAGERHGAVWAVAVQLRHGCGLSLSRAVAVPNGAVLILADGLRQPWGGRPAYQAGRVDGRGKPARPFVIMPQNTSFAGELHGIINEWVPSGEGS